MGKATFLKYDKPTLTVMVQGNTPEHVLKLMEKGHALGGEAFGIQAEGLKPEYQKPEVFRRLFAAAEGKPTYVTNYRRKETGYDDDTLAKGLLTLADCGAALCDVMGDMFCRHPEELTEDAAAIDKQMRLIDAIHEKGAQVLMSSHVLKYTSAERVLEIGLEQQRRGADIVKIVTYADNREQELENLRICHLLKEKLSVPFLFLAGGECTLHRRLGGSLGCCMYLCVAEHDEFSTKTQPLLSKMKAIRDNLEW